MTIHTKLFVDIFDLIVDIVKLQELFTVEIETTADVRWSVCFNNDKLVGQGYSDVYKIKFKSLNQPIYFESNIIVYVLRENGDQIIFSQNEEVIGTRFLYWDLKIDTLRLPLFHSNIEKKYLVLVPKISLARAPFSEIYFRVNRGGDQHHIIGTILFDLLIHYKTVVDHSSEGRELGDKIYAKFLQVDFSVKDWYNV